MFLVGEEKLGALLAGYAGYAEGWGEVLLKSFSVLCLSCFEWDILHLDRIVLN